MFCPHKMHREARLVLRGATKLCGPAEQEAIQSWAQSSGVAGDYAAICRDPKTKAHLLDEVNATGKEGKLKVGRLSQRRVVQMGSPRPGYGLC